MLCNRYECPNDTCIYDANAEKYCKPAIRHSGGGDPLALWTLYIPPSGTNSYDDQGELVGMFASSSPGGSPTPPGLTAAKANMFHQARRELVSWLETTAIGETTDE